MFSYNNILQIREDNGKLIAATENGIFFYTPATGEITKLSKANGLHEVKISAFDYNPATKTGLVGYTNGTMDVIKEEGITFIVDIPIATSYTGPKKVNHISITGDLAVVSTGYGVSVFNLNKKEFGDTAFFKTGSVYEGCNEAVIKDNTVFAATNSGIKQHEINVTFPIYTSWNTILTGTFKHIDIENNTIAFSNTQQAQYGDGNSFTTLPQTFSNIQDITVTPQNILVTDANTVYSYSTAGSAGGSLSFSEQLNTAWLSNGKLFAGTELSGILNSDLKSFKPDGPYNNRSYKINLVDDKIYVSSGLTTGDFNTPNPHPKHLGFYFYTGTEWVYPSYFKTNNANGFNVMDAIGNPKDYKEVFFNNYIFAPSFGIYKLKYNETSKDFDFVKHYPTGTSIYLNRPVGFTYDEQNNLYATLSYFSQNNSFDNISTGYGVYNSSSDQFIFKQINDGIALQKPVFYEGLLWMPVTRLSDMVFATDIKNSPANVNDDTTYKVTSAEGLPAPAEATRVESAIAISIDKFGDAWVGTSLGLRVIYNAMSVKEKPKAEPIIIERNGLGEELFRASKILQIETDSGNQKWVSIDEGGVFYLNANGQKTILQFNRENSPLPNNSVYDIKVDQKTGNVYFATLDGIVVYKSDVANVNENFGEVIVYPNPVVSAHYKGNVKIKGLAEKTNIRITDAAGNLVHQAVARGGYYEWDLANRGKRVASGIYFVLMTNEDGTDKATAKIAVVN